MARKKKPEEHENHERWLVSYADFITLLFAFFVVMYSLSSVNEGKYRVLSDAMISAFKSTPKSISPIQIGKPIKVPHEAKHKIPPKAFETISMPIQQQLATNRGKTGDDRDVEEDLNNIATSLEEALESLIKKDQVKVNRNGDLLEVEINSSVLFSSGGALLEPEALPVLLEFSKILSKFPNAIRVEGFTDDVEIDTPLYPSNWELSASRAASVVHLFSDEGVDPFQLQAVGFGQYRPVADNSTQRGRERNRRVVVVILSQTAKELYDNETLFKLPDIDEFQSDIDLDVPLEVIDDLGDDGAEPLAIPENMPTNLPLETRDSKSSKKGNVGVRSILKSINSPKPDLDADLDMDSENAEARSILKTLNSPNSSLEFDPGSNSDADLDDEILLE